MGLTANPHLELLEAKVIKQIIIKIITNIVIIIIIILIIIRIISIIIIIIIIIIVRNYFGSSYFGLHILYVFTLGFSNYAGKQLARAVRSQGRWGTVVETGSSPSRTSPPVNNNAAQRCSKDMGLFPL